MDKTIIYISIIQTNKQNFINNYNNEFKTMENE